MKFRLASDLHLEFYPDEASIQPLVESLACDDVDICVLAGDIVSAPCLDRITLLTQRYPNTRFLWVPGNHEYYRGSMQSVDEQMRLLADDTPNLTLLDCARYERFVGATLWYPAVQPLHTWYQWSDYYFIGASHDIFRKAEDHKAFLKEVVQPGDIVVTHMLPHPAAIAPRHRGSDTNMFFVHDMSSLIEDRQPAVWCFGHTHDSIDETVGQTRLVCNPGGYIPDHLNPEFNPTFTVELG